MACQALDLARCSVTVELATSRFQDAELIRASDLVPVGISVGWPKFALGYTALYMRELAPYGLLHIEDAEQFDAAYIARLEAVGPDVFAKRFAAVAAEHDKPGLALLCFDPVGVPCHRHVFGRWWGHVTGQQVPELQSPQPSLW